MPINKEDLEIYACPYCQGKLRAGDGTLQCYVCSKTYQVRGEIPDFIVGDLMRSTHPVLRRVNLIDWLAPIYETRLWYSVVLDLVAGRGRMSLPRLVDLIRGIVGSVTGLVLDVACGPGTFGRRVASPSRKVYGIDISAGMLNRGLAYARREHVTNIRFAQAQVEALPFGSETFEAAICSGSLHLFEDTLVALREIGRTLKPGAPLSVITFTSGTAAILRFPWVLSRLRRKGLRIFEIPELQHIFGEAGFEECHSRTYRSLLAVRAQKCQARRS